MSDSEELNQVAGMAVGYTGNDGDDSDSVEFLSPSTTSTETRQLSPPPSPSSHSETLRRSMTMSPELAQRSDSPRVLAGNSPRSSPRPDSPRQETRWRSSSSMQGGGTLRDGGKAAPSSANEVLMGARRTREVLQLSEETAALTRENAELKQLVRKLVARDEKSKKSRGQDLERVKAVLAANQAKTNQAIAQAEQDTVRAHQMTLSILTQYRDYMAGAEARLLVAERQLNEAKEAVEYFRARSAQTEDLAKSVVLFVRGEGAEEQQAGLSAAIKNSRERNPLPPRPKSSAVLDMAPEERKAAAEKEVEALAESDVLLAAPKFASLTDRLREFEHFLDLKKKKTLQKQASADDVNAVVAAVAAAGSSSSSSPSFSSSSASPSGAPATRGTSLSVSASSGMVLGLKAAQITGDAAPPIMSPSVASRKFGGGGTFQALVRERKTPQDFPFYELPSVLHVQRLVNLLAARNAGGRGKPVTEQPDPLREEANRSAPNLDWLCGEIVSPKKRCRVDPHWRSDSGRSLLHIICEYESCGRAVKVLLSEKYDCAALDETGLSAFHVACISGALEAVQVMCKHGPKSLLDLKCLGDLTPMHAAALFNRVSVLKLLLERGANGAPLDALGCSPLVYAVVNDKFAAAKFLADKVHGLVNTAQDGNSPLLFACCVAGVADVTALLHAGADPNVANAFGISPLWIAMQNDDADLALALLDFKPVDASQKLNLDQPLGPFGNTLLMQAIAFLSSSAKAASFAGMLLSKGASVHAVNKDKKTALFFAAAFDRLDVMRVLLERGADPNAKDANLNRPLHFAQSVDAVSLLFASGAKVNVKNKQGNTPLHVAFALQNRMTANILISSGGSESSCNAEGRTCLDLAQFLQTKIALPFFPGDLSFAETGGIMFK